MDLIWLIAVISFAIFGGLLWFVISLIRSFFISQRRSGFRHMKLAAALVIVGIIASAIVSVITAGVSTEPTMGIVEKGAVARKAEATSSLQSGKMSSSQEFIWIRANQRLIKQRLRDPDSARFSNDYVSYKSGAPIVCGTVNARNGFGGYTGAQHYIGAGETVGVFLASEVSDFDVLWRKLCN